MKKITLSKDEVDFIYYQLLARKEYFEEDMAFWAEKKDTKEVLRCAKAIEKIDELNKKILNV